MTTMQQTFLNPTRKVKHIYQYNFARMSGFATQRQETVGERIQAFCTKHDFKYRQFQELANHYAQQYDTRVTYGDIMNYIHKDVSPKIDKLYAISKVMGMQTEWFAGYGSVNMRSTNEIINMRGPAPIPFKAGDRK